MDRLTRNLGRSGCVTAIGLIGSLNADTDIRLHLYCAHVVALDVFMICRNGIPVNPVEAFTALHATDTEHLTTSTEYTAPMVIHERSCYRLTFLIYCDPYKNHTEIYGVLWSM
jgi:hypothetical protein